jgi:hypothetical protein
MKTYSDLLATNTLLPVTIILEPVGTPEIAVIINDNIIEYQQLLATTITDYVELFSPVTISVILSNKHYTTEYETAVIIKHLSIDNINLIPRYDYLAKYTNDHDNSDPTHYLGFNGKWTLTIDKPFYQWLHQAQGQGWLID